MASFITPPDELGTDPDSGTSEDAAAALTEPDSEEGVEAENLEMHGLVSMIRSAFNRAETRREEDENRWQSAYRNYRGLYSSDVKFTQEEKSQAFVKVTKTKVLAAYAQIVDVLFAGTKFPIGVEATPVPVGVEDAVHFDPNAPTKDKIEEATGQKINGPLRNNVSRPSLERDLGPYRYKLEPVEEQLESGPGKTPSAVTYEPAKRAARRMERRIEDQLEESSADKHLRNVAFEMSLLGTGILKGPFGYNKEYPRWTEDGEYDPIIEMIPKVEAVSLWDFYPDPDARHIDECEYGIQRHRMSRSQLRRLKRRPHFREQSIEDAIEMGPDYTVKDWEHALDDYNAQANKVNRYEVLEYWGMIDAETAEEAGIEIPESLEGQDELQINAWVCNGQILRAVLNPFVPARLPYHAIPYEVNPYSFFGTGVAENMEDTQLLMNGFMRMAVDNAALSGNLLIEVDETNLVPGQSLDVYPGKIFRRQAGAPGQAIFGTKFPNVTQECLQMFDKSRQLADESTGIPSFSHGMTGVMGVGRTASGMSMLMGAAAQNIKAVVRNIDDYLLAPLGKALFAFNMQFQFDAEFAKGDLSVVARGTESLMRNEIRSQRLLQFMQLSANPQTAPFVKYDYILREIAVSLDLDEDKVINDPREAAIQAQMMAEFASLMPQQGQQQGATSVPPVSDPTDTGGGNIAPGGAPEPGADGFTGAGGGANGGNPPAQTQ